MGFLFSSSRPAIISDGERGHGIEVKIANPYDAHTIASAIEKKMGFTYQARDWMEMTKICFRPADRENLMFFISSLLFRGSLANQHIDYGGHGKNLRYRDYENHGGEELEHHENIYD
jgi:hypothetical protein